MQIMRIRDAPAQSKFVNSHTLLIHSPLYHHVKFLFVQCCSLEPNGWQLRSLPCQSIHPNLRFTIVVESLASVCVYLYVCPGLFLLLRAMEILLGYRIGGAQLAWASPLREPSEGHTRTRITRRWSQSCAVASHSRTFHGP